MSALSSRVAVYDDLHAEFEVDRDDKRLATAWRPPDDLDVEAILLAGDIETDADRFAHFIRGVRATQRDTTAIVAIPGNHDTWGNDLLTQAAEFRAAIADVPNAYYLERSSVTLPSGLRILGATMWTDAEHEDGAVRMKDYVHGRIGDRGLEPADTTKIHKETVSWLDDELKRGDWARTIVMTHHAPSVLSNRTEAGRLDVLPYREEELEPLYCANLDTMIEMRGPALWVHGHVHRSVDYEIGNTRVLSNPRGYWNRDPRRGDENPGFRDRFVVQIDVDRENIAWVTTDHGATRKELRQHEAALAFAAGQER